MQKADHIIQGIQAEAAPQNGACKHCDGSGKEDETIKWHMKMGIDVPNFCTCADGEEAWKNFLKTPKAIEARRAVKIQRVQRLKKESGVASTFSQKRLQDLADKPRLHDIAKAYVEKWDNVSAEGIGIYFWGGVGRGKTHAVSAIANALMDDKLIGTLFLNVADWSDRMKSFIGVEKQKERRGKLVEMMKNADLLVLDDLGVEQHGDWIDEQLYLVINHRYEHKLPMIITSNQSLEDLERTYKPQIVSRIRERCRILQISGDDRRKDLRPLDF